MNSEELPLFLWFCCKWIISDLVYLGMTLFHLQLKNYFAGYKVFAWQFSPSFGTSNNVISWSQGIHSFCFFTLWPHHEACGILVPSAWVLSRFSCVWLCATLWAVAHQAPLSAGFSRQEYWSGMPYPCPGNLPKPVIKPRSPALQADSLSFEPPGKPENTGVGIPFSRGSSQAKNWR